MISSMASCKIKLLRREEIAEGTTAFIFEKPAGFSVFKNLPHMAVNIKNRFNSRESNR